MGLDLTCRSGVALRHGKEVRPGRGCFGRFAFQDIAGPMPSKPCAHPGCRVLVPVGQRRCALHAKAVARERWSAADLARGQTLPATASTKSWKPHGPWRRWYKLKAWAQLRDFVLTRDGHRCQWPGCGVVLRKGRHDPHAAVVDHRVPHRGDRFMFFDPGNCWSLCKAHHDSSKQSIERGGRAAGALEAVGAAGGRPGVGRKSRGFSQGTGTPNHLFPRSKKSNRGGS